ncbi:hypothetical protein [Amycolatopsis sp. NPDC004625]|uniref:hypothetical protein n=1 Tax=Amycolatopsis sp. NPDC004625 TaxID=3154670 RepID=UPI0033AA3CF8
MRRAGFLAAVVAGLGLLAAPAADASAITQTWTSQTAWVHQCAAMACGYHEVPGDQLAFVYCAATTDENFWNLIVTKGPWNGPVTVAGYVSTDALREPVSSPRCGGFFGSPAKMDFWAHSCPMPNCGYGVIKQGDSVKELDTVTGPDGRLWRLVVDLSSRDLLAGYVYP